MDKRNKQLYSSFHRLSAPEEIKSRIHKKISGRLMQEETVTAPKYEAQPDSGNSIRLKRPFPLAAAAVFGIVAAAAAVFAFTVGLKPEMSNGSDIIDNSLAEDNPLINGDAVSSNGSKLTLGEALRELDPGFYQLASVDRDNAGSVIYLGDGRYIIGIADKSLRKQSYRLFDLPSGEILLDIPAQEGTDITVKDVGDGFTVQIGDSAALYNNDGEKLWDIPETADLDCSDFSRDLTRFCTVVVGDDRKYWLELYDVQSGEITNTYRLDTRATPYISDGSDKIFLVLHGNVSSAGQYWLFTLDIPTWETDNGYYFDSETASGVSGGRFVVFYHYLTNFIVSDGEGIEEIGRESSFALEYYNLNYRFTDDGNYAVFWDRNFTDNEMIWSTVVVYDTETFEPVWYDRLEYENSRSFSYEITDISLDSEKMQCYISLSGFNYTTHERVYLNIVGDMTNDYLLRFEETYVSLREEGLGRDTFGDALTVQESLFADSVYKGYMVDHPLGDGYYLISSDIDDMGDSSGRELAVYNSNNNSIVYLGNAGFSIYDGGLYYAEDIGTPESPWYCYSVYDRDEGYIGSYYISDGESRPAGEDTAVVDIPENMEYDSDHTFNYYVCPVFDSEGRMIYYSFTCIKQELTEQGRPSVEDIVTLIYQRSEDGLSDKLIYSGDLSVDGSEPCVPREMQPVGEHTLRISGETPNYCSITSVLLDTETGELRLSPVEHDNNVAFEPCDNGYVLFEPYGNSSHILHICEEGEELQQIELQPPEKVADSAYGYSMREYRISRGGEYYMIDYWNNNYFDLSEGGDILLTVYNKAGELLYEEVFTGEDISNISFDIDPYKKQIVATAWSCPEDLNGELWEQYVIDF